MPKKWIKPSLFSFSLSILSSSLWAENLDRIDQVSSQNSNFLNTIPSIIDATPNFLPAQSDHVTTPNTLETENNTWADQKQKGIRTWTDRTAQKIDTWFGEPNPNQPASATLRIIMDNSWNKYDEYEIKPRIRGKINLPTLERKLSVVFGDDSLDNELDRNVAITNENPAHNADNKIDRTRTREDNSSIALRWSELSQRLPFATDLDLGVRSGDDIYVRFKASKDWTLENDYSFHAEQIYRYGIDSENYLRTNLELTHARPQQPFISNQLSLTYADTQEDDLTWDNYSFRQHQFFHANRFSYGLYTGGYLNGSSLRLNRWGPYVSWRQPVFREWFFVQADLNYQNDRRLNRDHYASALIRLEALF